MTYDSNAERVHVKLNSSGNIEIDVGCKKIVLTPQEAALVVEGIRKVNGERK